MARVVVVEVLDPRGGVRHRARLDRFPATIGRGYDNDVILDDRFVSPRHLRLTEDEAGELVVEDLGSVNGLLLPAPGNGRRAERVARVPVRSGGTVRVGHTVLRFFDPAHPVPDALPDAAAAAPPVLRRAQSPAARLGIVALVVGVLALQAWLGSSSETEADDLASEAVAGLSALLLWSGAWALASRIVTHRFHLLSHLAWAGTMVVAVLLLTAAGEWFEFFFPSNPVGGVLGTLVGVALAALALYGHLTIIGTMSRRGRWLAAGSVTLGIGALSMLLSLSGDESTWRMDYSGALKPVAAALIPASSLGDFVAGAGELQEDVDELAREDAEEDADDDEADGADSAAARPDTTTVTTPPTPRTK